MTTAPSSRALTPEQARQLVEEFDWDSLRADAEDIRTAHESLSYCVGDERDEAALEDALSELFDAHQHIVESDPEHNAPILSLLLSLSTCRERFDEPERLLDDVAYALATHGECEAIRQAVIGAEDLLAAAWAQSELQGRVIAVMVALLPELKSLRPRVREAVSAPQSSSRFRVVCGLSAAVFESNLMALGNELRAGADDDELVLSGAAACMRLAVIRGSVDAESLETELTELVDRFGHPGWVERAYEQAFPLEMPEALRESKPLTRFRGYEPATVLFAGPRMLLVQHATRGNFTLSLSETGLSKGDSVELGGIAPEPYRTVARVRFQRDGQTVELSMD